MSYPFTAFDYPYELDVVRYRNTAGYPGPRGTTRCSLNDPELRQWARTSREETAAEYTKEWREEHKLDWKKTWRSHRFVSIEKRMIMDALKTEGIRSGWRNKIRRLLYSKEHRGPLMAPIVQIDPAELHRRRLAAIENGQVTNDLATRQIKTSIVTADEANVHETNHWKWFFDAIAKVEDGQILAVDVPPDVEAGRMQNQLRGVLSGNKQTQMRRWSIKKSADNSQLFVCCVGTWSDRSTPQESLAMTLMNRTS